LPSSIEQVHQEYKDRGLAVLAIDFEEEPSKVRAWADRSLVSMPVLLDRDGAVTRRYDVSATPTTFIVSREGTLVAKALGNRAWRSPAARALFEALLAR
jgi:peroxiredoxin